MNPDDEVPIIDIDPFGGHYVQKHASGRSSTIQDNSEEYSPEFAIKDEEKELYEQAVSMEGYLTKVATNLFKSKLKRYFKVIAHGSYLVYWKEVPKPKECAFPCGVFFVGDMFDIEQQSGTR